MVKNLFHKKRNTLCYLIVEVTFAFLGSSVQKLQLSLPISFLPYIQVSMFLSLIVWKGKLGRKSCTESQQRAVGFRLCVVHVGFVGLFVLNTRVELLY